MTPTITDAVEKETLLWLLQDACPPARFLAQTALLKLPVDEPAVKATRASVLSWEPVATLLAEQAPEGNWRFSEDCYWPKWTATTWPLLVLAELGAPGADPRIRAGCEFWLSTATAQSRTFPAPDDPKDPLSAYRALWEPCVTGNMIRALCAFGYGRDPRVLEMAEWLTKHQLPDGGWNCTTGEWGTKVKSSSFCSTIEPLWGLAAIPRALWSKDVWHAVPGGVEFLLERFLFRSRRTGKIIDEEWTRLHFPLFYFYDILHGLRVLADLGLTQDGRDREALDMLVHKRGADGRWRLESDASALEPTGFGKDAASSEWRKGCATEPIRILEALGAVGEASKFVTVHALRVLAAYGRWSPPMIA